MKNSKGLGGFMGHKGLMALVGLVVLPLAAEQEHLLRYFARTGIDRVAVTADQPYIQGIRALFKRRAAKR